MKDSQSAQCQTCSTELKDNFCSVCGRQKSLKRIDKMYVLSEISSVLNFDRGFLYTIKELILRPGKTVRDFILTDRNRLVKPIVFIILCSLIYTVCQQVLNFEDGYVAYSAGEKTTTQRLFQWISGNYGYANILMALMIATFIKLFFRKQAYNYFEILILLCFVMGVGMLLFAVFGLIQTLINMPIIDKGFLLGIIYIIWGIGNFFKGKRWLNYLKSFLAYFLGMLGFFLLVMLFGSFIDIFYT